MSDEIARVLTIYGTVQGVTFRASTRQRAHALGITGWVTNTPAGTVEAHVQGPPEAVEALIEFCHTGPPAASVTDVDIEETAVAEFDTFSIRR